MDTLFLQIITERSIPIPESGCIIWLGSIWGGYGVFKVKGISYKPHRVAFELAKGSIPAGLHICHKCDNPLCINPNHLFLGSAADNMRDRENKGRGAKRFGEHNGRSKLTADNVLEIRASTETTIALANRFGVTQAVVSKAKLGRTWKHL